MHRPSYPRPQSIPGRIGLHTPQEFIPIDTSSDYGSQPSLPFPPRIFPDASWILSTHLVPAALPRTVPDIPQVVLPAWPADKAKRGEMAKKIEDQLVATRQKQWSGELQGPRSRKPLWVSLSRYRRKDVSPKDGRKGVTLFLVHANGFLKEVRRINYLYTGYHLAEPYSRFGSLCCSSCLGSERRRGLRTKLQRYGHGRQSITGIRL